MSEQLVHLPDSAFAGRSILVLSDAFPPHADGGAELSLHASLSILPHVVRKRVVVLSFSNRIEVPTLSTDGSMTVLHCPDAAGWPYEHLLRRELMAVGQNRFIKPVLHARLTKVGQYALRSNRPAIHGAYSESRLRPRGGILTDHLINERDIRVRITNSVTQRMEPLTALLADNTRSILIGSKLLDTAERPPASAAIVRDNRFHCARPAQNRMVGGKTCKVCQFQCAAEDVENGPVTRRKDALARTHVARQEALRRYDKVVVTSHELMRHVAPLLTPSNKIVRVPNAVGSLKVVDRYTRGVARAKNCQLVIIGMLNENKGQLSFIRRATPWLQANPDIEIVLCGRGDRLAKAIAEHAKKNDISAQIQLRGYCNREQLFQAIREATLVLAPTEWPEPFGRVPLEAGAGRRAIVAFGVGGLNESVIDGYNGRLAKPGDYDGFISAIDDLLGDPKARRQMERNARALVEREFGPEKTVQLLAEEVFGVERSSFDWPPLSSNTP